MDVNKVNDFVKNLSLDGLSRIIYFHSVGIDKFEPKGIPHRDFDNDGIDDDVLKSNYLYFKHLAEPLLDRVSKEGIPTTICNIGSISDVFEVPYWQSFYKSKNKVRQFCKSINTEFIKSVFLNVSSTLDETGNKYDRKYADTTYWQTTSELLSKSFDLIENFQTSPSSYAEFDFYKHNPSFRKDYFTNLPNLYSLWQRDLGFEGKEIPLGLRI